MRIPPAEEQRFDKYEPEKYNCISVQDDFIEPLTLETANIDFYWHTLSVPGKGFAYCGITLIPPSSIDALVEVIGEKGELAELKNLLIQAKAEEKFVIHFGV